jgi:hypothetical protein
MKNLKFPDLPLTLQSLLLLLVPLVLGALLALAHSH